MASERAETRACGVIPGHQVRWREESASVHVPCVPEGEEPEIMLIREGDEVRAIEVVCTCGKRTRIKCLF